MENIQSLSTTYLENARKSFGIVKTKSELDSVKAKYLGQESSLAKDLKSIVSLPITQRANVGKQLNHIRKELEELYKNTQQNIQFNSASTSIDLSKKMNIYGQEYGHMHPTSMVLNETYKIFTELGFAIVDSPEIETDWYNFESLNMPLSHPARDMQDTFYIDNGKMNLLPRSHTSGMQVRFMEENIPPYKIIVPGRVFRNENEDATHAWIFNQVEGLVVGEGVSMSDLKGVLLRVVKSLLGPDADIRFRASYFPYTEPSVELDCRYNGKWLELGGAGMVHPQVLKNGGVDPNKYSGFAFGWGAERFAVIKYGISDLRQLWRPKFNFLEQF